MKRQHYWMIGLLAGLLLACSLPSWNPTPAPESAPTATATPTHTLTLTPTATLTATPTPVATSTPTAPPPTAAKPTRAVGRYDLSDVRIQPDDLPDTFIQMDIASLGIDETQLSADGYQIENMGLFTSASPPAFIFVFLVQAESAADQESVDLLLNSPETLLEMFTSQIGTGISDQRVMTDLPPVGEKSSGLSATLENAEQDFRMDVVIFRRRSVVGFAGTMYPDGEEAPVPVEQVALLLDEYLESALLEQSP